MADADAVRGAGVPERLPAEPAGGPSPAEPGKVMTLVDHLDGAADPARFAAMLAVVAGSAIGFWQAPAIRTILVSPLPEGHRTLIVLGPGDGFAIALRIAVVGRDHPRDARAALPAVGVRRAWPDPVRAAGAPAVDPARTVLLRPRRQRSPGSSCRSRSRSSWLHGRDHPRRHTGGPAVLRLRHDDVPRVRAADGVPDRPLRAVQGRDRDVGSGSGGRAGWSSSGSRFSPRWRRPAAT